MLAWADLSCATWPVKPQSQPGPIAAAGSAPHPRRRHQGRPRHPLPLGRRPGKKELQNGHLLTFNGSGHTAYNPRLKVRRLHHRRLPPQGHSPRRGDHYGDARRGLVF